ncbi:MAG TPA: MarR family winged helix-turn-helix transcriptional regulator [Actinotalea caeni]|uniref:MarR family winged helix-turn-helix transcriptional regulator n=1 Tax=Actinotalea caeni TaxID=1348467 RepID=UPI002B4AAEE8|nr:MarR family winged helix-turn-helix transcriptional regulator [Actinotalea caeni]HLV56667.1 MarR family winged helix-turn-helix transcriptional regulator [Actinotalea caeni]
MPLPPPQRLLATPSWLLTQVAAAAGRRSRERCEAVGAARYHYAILCAVEEFGPCSQAEIGARCHMDRKDVAERVRELERQQCVVRCQDPADPRRKLVTLTDAGRARLEEIAAEIAVAQADLMEPLDDGERDALVAALQKLLGR